MSLWPPGLRVHDVGAVTGLRVHLTDEVAKADRAGVWRDPAVALAEPSRPEDWDHQV